MGLGDFETDFSFCTLRTKPQALSPEAHATDTMYPVPDTIFQDRTIKIVTFLKTIPSNPHWTLGIILG
jgi:hypothetical protein